MRAEKVGTLEMHLEDGPREVDGFFECAYRSFEVEAVYRTEVSFFEMRSEEVGTFKM
jgi:hypothetical protein